VQASLPQLYSTLLVVVIATAATCGCASWTTPGTDLSLPKAKSTGLSSRAAPVIEAEFVAVLPHDPAAGDDGLWQWIEETRIDAGRRRRLLANGIRAGVVTNEDQFRRRLGEQSIETGALDQFLSEAAIESEMSHGVERLPLRYGRRYELPLRQPLPGSSVTLVRIKNQTAGRTLLRPQHLLAVTAHRGDDIGRIELQLRPEIQYGDLKQKWITSDSALRIDARRETWSLPELDLRTPLAEGETLVITAAEPFAGLGAQMFVGPAADGAEQQVILLMHWTGDHGG